MNVSTRIGSSLLAADGPGRGMHGGGRDGFPIMAIVCLVVVAALVALAVVALRRNGSHGGSLERRRQEFEDWHRAAHAGPVPTMASSPWPTATMPVAPAPVAPAPAPPVAPAPAPVADAAPSDATPPATTD